MRRKTNRWHDAIMCLLDASDTPMTPAQIWSAMEKAGFEHKSVSPRATLGARITELCAMKTVERVGAATYRRATPSHHAPPILDAGIPEDLSSYN